MSGALPSVMRCTVVAEICLCQLTPALATQVKGAHASGRIEEGKPEGQVDVVAPLREAAATAEGLRAAKLLPLLTEAERTLLRLGAEQARY